MSKLAAVGVRREAGGAAIWLAFLAALVMTLGSAHAESHDHRDGDSHEDAESECAVCAIVAGQAVCGPADILDSPTPPRPFERLTTAPSRQAIAQSRTQSALPRGPPKTLSTT